MGARILKVVNDFTALEAEAEEPQGGPGGAGPAQRPYDRRGSGRALRPVRHPAAAAPPRRPARWRTCRRAWSCPGTCMTRGGRRCSWPGSSWARPTWCCCGTLAEVLDIKEPVYVSRRTGG